MAEQQEIKMLKNYGDYAQLTRFVDAYRKIKNNPAEYMLDGQLIENFYSLSETDIYNVIAQNYTKLGYTNGSPSAEVLRNASRNAEVISGKGSQNMAHLDELAKTANNKQIADSFRAFRQKQDEDQAKAEAAYNEATMDRKASAKENRRLKGGIFGRRLGQFFMGVAAIGFLPAMFFGAVGIVGGVGALLNIASFGVVTLTAAVSFLAFHFLKEPFKALWGKINKSVEAAKKKLAGEELGSNKDLSKKRELEKTAEKSKENLKDKTLYNSYEAEALNELNQVSPYARQDAPVEQNLQQQTPVSTQDNKLVDEYNKENKPGVENVNNFLTTKEKQDKIKEVADNFVEAKIKEIQSANPDRVVDDKEKEELQKQVNDSLTRYFSIDQTKLENSKQNVKNNEIEKLVAPTLSYEYSVGTTKYPATLEFDVANLASEVINDEQVQKQEQVWKDKLAKDKNVFLSHAQDDSMKKLSYEDRFAYAREIVEERLSSNQDFSKLSKTEKERRVDYYTAKICNVSKNENYTMTPDEYVDLQTNLNLAVVDDMSKKYDSHYQDVNKIQKLQERFTKDSDIAYEIGKAEEALRNQKDDESLAKHPEKLVRDLSIVKLAEEKGWNLKELETFITDVDGAKNYKLNQVHKVDSKGKNTNEIVDVDTLIDETAKSYKEACDKIQEVEESWKKYHEDQNAIRALSKDNLNAKEMKINQEDITDNFVKDVFVKTSEKLGLDYMNSKSLYNLVTNSKGRESYNSSKKNYASAENIDDTLKVSEESSARISKQDLINAVNQDINAQVEDYRKQAQKRIDATNNYSRRKRVYGTIAQIANNQTYQRNKDGKYEKTDIAKFYDKDNPTNNNFEKFDDRINPIRKEIGVSEIKKAQDLSKPVKPGDVKKSKFGKTVKKYFAKPKFEDYTSGEYRQFNGQAFEAAVPMLNQEFGTMPEVRREQIGRVKSATKGLFKNFVGLFAKAHTKNKQRAKNPINEATESVEMEM